MSSKSVNQINKEIERLLKDKEQLLRAEREIVIPRIRQQMEALGITAADLGFAPSTKTKKTRKLRAQATAAPNNGAKPKLIAGKVKYADDKGNTWTGRGPKPDWLKAALAAGSHIDDFLAKQ